MGIQSIWTLADYARVADWIGSQNNNNGVTAFEIEKHFSGCGGMLHRIGTMKRQGIIAPVPITNGNSRVIPKQKVKYIQLRKIDSLERPLPRGQGFPCLTKYSTPLEKPTTMSNSQPPAPAVVVSPAPPQVGREQAHEILVSYSTATKTLMVRGKDAVITLLNVNLKLDLS